ncbi:hypothetical protein RND81_07G151300 [Saponaria officinalis]|uniref:Protein SCAR n=2 Tax=Saponaria officinalis TaxID=3572 RepID=A0AAW1JNL8_SAPOF
MPLGRFGVRNEYGLGGKELYKEGVESEDPKAVLEGVAVAGLVGLLRQLGDLSQFAAEVFHGLQEQLASTGSRSRKLVSRVQRVEASLPSLEKAMLSQTSHIHFAYTPGSVWHPRIKKEQNHFIGSDLPHFIMDSYEECHEPPRLHLLDRFDARGSGSCLKRYTDPTFFRKASTSSEARNSDKSRQERKARKIKRRRSLQRSGRLPNSVHNMDNNGRAPISSQTGRGESSVSHTSSSFERTFMSDVRDQSDSRNSKESLGFVGSLSHPSISKLPDKMENKEFVSNMGVNVAEIGQKYHDVDQTAAIREDTQARSSTDDTAPHSSNVTWDEKLEIIEHVSLNDEIEDSGQLSPETKDYALEQNLKPVAAVCVKNIHQVDDLSERGINLNSNSDLHYIDAVVDVKLNEPTGLNYQHEQHMTHADADEHHEDDISELGSSPESNVRSFRYEEGLSEHGSTSESNATFLDSDVELTGKDSGIDDVQDLDESTFDLHEHDLVHVETFPQLPSFSEVQNDSHEQSLVIATPESSPQATGFDKGENSLISIANSNFVNDHFDGKLSIGDIQYMLETIDNNNWAIETVDANRVCTPFPPVENLSEDENTRGSIADGNVVSEFDSMSGVGDVQYILETNPDNAKSEAGIVNDEYDGLVEPLTEGVNDENVIEWHHHDDIDSETDNFVDALYNIDSESESDVETYTKNDVNSLSAICQWDENASTDVMANEVNHTETKQLLLADKVNRDDGVYEAATGHEKDTLSHEESSESASSSSNEIQGVDICDNADGGVYEAATGHEKDTLSHEESSESASSSSNEIQGVDICNNADDGVYEAATGDEKDTLSHEESRESASSSSNEIQGVDICNNADDGVYEAATGHEKDTLSHEESSESASSSSNEIQGVDICDNADGGVYEAATGHKKDTLSHEESSECASSSSNEIQGVDICNNADEIEMQPAVNKPVEEASSQVSHHDETSCTPHVSEEMSFGSTNFYPPALWTNGTLFGLQPSKPTVIGKSNSVSAAPTSSGNGDIVDRCSPTVNDPAGSLNHVAKGVLEEKSNKSLHDDETTFNDDAVTRDVGNGHVTSHEVTVPAAPVLKNIFGEDRSSILSLLGRNLLKSGLRRSASLGYEDKSKPSNPVATNIFDNRCAEAVADLVPQTKLNEKSESPVNSPPPSPPLEHMKISFRPVNGFETSKLKLKYPEGIDPHEMSVETFPSFQLVPEFTMLQHDMDSDSDNDTFCQSYACVSDYSTSRCSDSDSEQWETGDTSVSNECEVYDGLRRISSAESYCSSSLSMSRPTSQLPTLDNKNKLGYEEMKVCLHAEADQPPPLPPLQWHISKSLLRVVEDKPEQECKSFNQSFDSRVLESDISDVTLKQKKVAELKVDNQKQSNQGDNGRIADDEGDFLHQIRTKSFNLKRTDAARSCISPGLATSNKVTAILQKANAIRQAVGSDGEDDSWSDT